MAPPIEIKEIIRDVAKEYAENTNKQIAVYYKQTTSAIDSMATSVEKMADSVKEANDALIRHEEKQNSNNERTERLEQTIRDQGIMQRTFEKDYDDKLDKLRSDVNNNSLVRKATLWLAATVIAAMIGGGMLFSALTGKIPAQQKGKVNEDTSNQKETIK